MISRPQRGFTLVELMITVAILGILIALSTAALGGLRPRAEVSSAASELSAVFKAARHHAKARNAEVWFGVLVPTPAQAGTGQVRYFVLEDSEAELDPTALNNNWPTSGDANMPGSVRVIDQGRFPMSVAPVSRQDAGGWGEAPPELQPAEASLATGCSFCNFDSGAGASVGWIVALPRGEIRVWGAAEQGNVEGIILGSVARDGGASPPTLVVFTAPFGITDTFRLDP